MQPKPSWAERLKNLIIGSARNPQDRTIFHKLSLIAFFAWVGLGADGISSSCYGPEEAFLALGKHPHLGIFIALGTALTVFIIGASYFQIIELFPTGGGGYLVASKLLSPTIGMVSGCGLLIDYVLTIAISIASGADALFSLLPPQWYPFKIGFATLSVVILTLMNMRGVKESIVPLVPIFLTFIITHIFIIAYALMAHSTNFPAVIEATAADVQSTRLELGFVGMLFLLLRAFTHGAGTFTGIEAVSNAVPILREPRVETAKRTMRYMAISLAFTAMGLMLAYLLYQVQPQHGKTLNAVLLENVTRSWGEHSGYYFVLIALISEAALLFVAAQAGFSAGPRVLANMASDRWFPTKFAMLSDRFVTQNGILLMGGAALFTMLLTRASVRTLVVLYSITVFVTYVLSQLGLVRHWWRSRLKERNWFKKLLVNIIGLVPTTFILVSLIIFKFNEGGWITLLITCALIGIAVTIKRHYNRTARILSRLDSLVLAAGSTAPEFIPDIAQNEKQSREFDPKAKTAILLVNGFNGLGLHTLFSVIRLFKGIFKNFVFVQIGVIDTGVFKGVSEIDRLQNQVQADLDHYVHFMKQHGYYAEGMSSMGTDVVDETAQIAPKILERFPQAVFFGGQLVFPEDTFISRWLHNYTVFAMQRRFYHQGIPVVVLPIRV